MRYKSIDTMIFPNDEEGRYLSKLLSTSTKFSVVSEDDDFITLQCENWNEIKLSGEKEREWYTTDRISTG